jgi:hypothetical protein
VIACDRRHITEAERAAISSKYEEIAKMLNGLIDHLEKEDRSTDVTLVVRKHWCRRRTARKLGRMPGLTTPTD